MPRPDPHPARAAPCGFARRLAGLSALCLAVACGDGPSGPDPQVAVAVSVVPAAAEVDIGSSVQLHAAVTNGLGDTLPRVVAWTSSDPSVATVDGSGRVDGLTEGSVTVTASHEGLSGSATVSVLDPFPPDPPTDLAVAAAAFDTVVVTWIDRSGNEDGFVVERETVAEAGGGGAAAFEEVGRVGPGVETFRDEGVEGSTPYRYRVRAFNENGSSPYAGPETVRTPPAPLVVESGPLGAGEVGQAYAATLPATGGESPIVWTLVSGELPPGLELGADGSVTGTPASTGTSEFAARAASDDGQAATGTFSITVEPGPVQVTTASLPSGLVDAPYSATLAAGGGDGVAYAWSIVAGALPPGLGLAAEGHITGTPAASGSFAVTIRVESGGRSAQRAYTLVVAAQPVEIVTSSLPDATRGVAYSATLAATGGDGTVIWSVTGGGLPPGLSVSPGGVVSGTPSLAQDFTFTVQAASAGHVDAAELSLTVFPPDDPGFDIELVYLSSLSSVHRNAFEAARARWQSLITSDLPAVPGPFSCGGFHPAVEDGIEDLLIFVQVDSIDGVGNTLGSAGYCLRRPGGLPLTGRMSFDAADLDAMAANGILEEVILHEMGHVLGIGTLWDDFGLLAGTCAGGDPIFLGPRAIEAFDDVGGGTYVAGGKVPVEDQGSPGDGSNCAHWRKTVFGTELMTPSISSSAGAQLSIVSVESLADLGYQVNPAGADPYTLPVPVPVPAPCPAGTVWHLGGDVWIPPREIRREVGPIRPPGR